MIENKNKPTMQHHSIMGETVGKILVLGSGALSIGQAGEFDYSGSQALKAFEENGYKTVLINPNIATIQTESSDKRNTYLYPITYEWVEKIIKKEKPRAIVAGFGGQTALNCVLELEEKGILKKYNIVNLGTKLETLRLTEDRDLFAKTMKNIEIPVIDSYSIAKIEESDDVFKALRFPIIIRAAYALGGLGSGFANNPAQAKTLIKKALNLSPQVLLEKSLKGWREVEYEVMRDKLGNKICICNMENLDPLGVHTGDSIVVAPSQTLNDEEYQLLRTASLTIVEELKIVGECNVQFALDPQSQQFYVIEVNARLSRSSALASKATGYPIAYIAAKLVSGFSLLELRNPVTKSTTAFFEPALDYVVVKMPRWDLAKFPGAIRKLGSSMKSVGEVMAIGRNFAEALQKAVRMSSENPLGLSERRFSKLPMNELIEDLSFPTDERLYIVKEMFQRGASLQDVHQMSQIDKWFLKIIEDLVEKENNICSSFSENELQSFKLKENEKLLATLKKLLANIPRDTILDWKQWGFSDRQIISAIIKEAGLENLFNQNNFLFDLEQIFRNIRIQKAVQPSIKAIDTTSGEFPAPTNYFYMSYQGLENDSIPFEKEEETLIVLGGGSYRIGSSVEFDWCAVKTSEYIRKSGKKSIMINCNPETVSTDFSSSDKLYFEELSVERVLDIYQYEQANGLIASMGGQGPNCVAADLAKSGAKLLGHDSNTIWMAENRTIFSNILDKCSIDQPRWKSAVSLEEVDEFVEKVKFPILVRPSFVLSGTAMKVAFSRDSLNLHLKNALNVSPDYPVVISEFLMDHCEIELDGVAMNGKIILSFMSEHLENAGVHSGDSTLVYPAQKLYVETVRRVKQAGAAIASELKLNGPFNIQFLASGNKIKVIECNARASRSFPFISKVTGVNLAELATQVIINEFLENKKIALPDFDDNNIPFVGVKAPMFSFTRLEGADPLLGVEMYSTGEVACLGESFEEALLLSLEATGVSKPQKGILISAGRLHEKVKLLDSIKQVYHLGIPLYASSGTARFLKENGLDVIPVKWPHEDEENNVITLVHESKVDLVINIPKSLEAEELKNGSEVRKATKAMGLALITNAELATAFFSALCYAKEPLKEVILLPE